MSQAKRLLSMIGEAGDEQEHWDALKTTGFYGKQGAGCIIMSDDTKRFLIPFRSAQVEQPHTYGTIGGAIDANEVPSEAVKREVQEECGYGGSLSLIPLYIFKSGTFQYHNFLATVTAEFNPRKNWETDYFKWVTLEELVDIEPKHFGLAGVLNHDYQVLVRAVGVQTEGWYEDEQERKQRELDYILKQIEDMPPLGTTKQLDGHVYELKMFPIDQVNMHPDQDSVFSPGVDMYKKFLKEVGVVPPPTISRNEPHYPKDLYFIENGHHRIEAAKDLGMREIPMWISIGTPKECGVESESAAWWANFNKSRQRDE